MVTYEGWPDISRCSRKRMPQQLHKRAGRSSPPLPVPSATDNDLTGRLSTSASMVRILPNWQRWISAPYMSGLESDLAVTEKQRLIAEEIKKEILTRLQFLLDVGLGYLSLSRASASLSGGEPTHTVGHPDWVRAGECVVHSRRTQHRVAPAR